MKVKNKKRFLVCVLIILLITLLFPRGNYNICNAIVNAKNGDIAYACFDDSADFPKIKIFQFNKEGELLFSTYVPSPEGGSNAFLLFHEYQLCVIPGRTNIIYSFDREGNPTTNDIAEEEIKEKSSFDGWEKSLVNRKYTLGEYVYCYEGPTLFRYRARLTIIHEGRKIVIYEDS